MKAQNLQKATVLLAEIHELDKQILALDKKAMGIANGEQHLSIKVSFEKEKVEGALVDETFDQYSIYQSIMGMSSRSAKPKTDLEDHAFKVNETECLFVIGALIQAKKEYRRNLYDQIINLGVTI